MHISQLLHTWLDNACSRVDKRLRRTLFAAAETLVHCKALSIFGLGRHFNRDAKVKHNIKCIDRLFGNVNLHRKKECFYEWMVKCLVKEHSRPLIIMDWSRVTVCGKYHFLRASLPAKGRAITLYECAYPLCEQMKQKTHAAFLRRLKDLLPKGCKPIIITDAGFRNPWFKGILSLGWDFIGRARHTTGYRLEGENSWKSIKTLYAQASNKAVSIGKIELARKNTITCYAYLMRRKKQHRIKKNLAGEKVRACLSKKYEHRANDPWLVMSSLSQARVTAGTIMKMYRKRMQIEESFRDLKNTRNGLSLRHYRGHCVERFNIALLIAALAVFALWVVGMAAKAKRLHYTFQANTEKRRAVLSIFSIGWQTLQRKIKWRKKEWALALQALVLSTYEEAVLC
jgi:Transposase DDE domain